MMLVSGSRAQKRTRRSVGRAFATLTAALALALQAFVVQPHFHAIGPSGGFAFEHAADGASAVGVIQASALDDQIACAVCEAMAAAGRTVLPHVLTAIVANRVALAKPTLELRAAPRALTHTWRSRAPPIAL